MLAGLRKTFQSFPVHMLHLLFPADAASCQQHRSQLPVQQSMQKLLRRIVCKNRLPPGQKSQHFLFCHPGQEIKDNPDLSFLFQGFGRKAAHLEDRDTGDAIVGKLHLPRIGTDFLSRHIQTDGGVCPDARQLSCKALVRLKLHQGREGTDDRVSQGFCQGVAAAVRTKSRRRLASGSQDQGIAGKGAASLRPGSQQPKPLSSRLGSFYCHAGADLHPQPLQLHGQCLPHSGSLVAGRVDKGSPCLSQKSQPLKKAQRILRTELCKNLFHNPAVSAPEIHCLHIHIREIAPPVPRREDLFAGHLFFLQYRHPGALPGCRYGSSHAGRPASCDQYSHRVTSPFRTRYSRDIRIPSFAWGQVSPPWK